MRTADKSAERTRTDSSDLAGNGSGCVMRRIGMMGLLKLAEFLCRLRSMRRFVSFFCAGSGSNGRPSSIGESSGPSDPVRTEEKAEPAAVDTRQELAVTTNPCFFPACLEYQENGLRMQFLLGDGVTHIGRSLRMDCSVVSPYVSRAHADVMRINGSYFLLDVGSRCGTYLNGSQERLTVGQPYELHSSDEIQLADMRLRFSLLETGNQERSMPDVQN